MRMKGSERRLEPKINYIFLSWLGADQGQLSGKSRISGKKFDFPSAWFIIVKPFLKEVIPGASARAHYSQEVLKPRCSGGLGKARIPKALDEAGEDRLGLGLLKVSSSTISFLPPSG